MAVGLGLLAVAPCSYGQQAATRPPRAYVGVEAGLFFNRATQLSQRSDYLTPRREVNPTAALVLGYCLTGWLALELRGQDLPVTTGFDYERPASAGYLGLSESYTQDYLYVPLLAVWRVLGRQARLHLDLTAGGGPAFTDPSPSLVTPNGTEVYYSLPGGGIGSGPTAPPGATVDATVTQYLARQQGVLGVLEAGLRGSWRMRPRLALDLTARQLWGLTASAREIDLTLQTPATTLATVQRTPVRGVCASLAVRYLLW